jgi:type VII secretion integral membrane protein EccD
VATLESDVRRVAVQTRAGRLDLALPADAAVGAILPVIVDIAAPSRSADPLDVPTGWQLSRVGGCSLSPRDSLRASGVNDGELLVLSSVELPSWVPPVDDAVSAIATTLDQKPRWTPRSFRVATVFVALCCGSLVAYALLRGTGEASAVIAGSLGVAAFIGAWLCKRADHGTAASPTLAGMAVMCAATAGYLAVPGDSTAPKLVLAAASCATASILAIRWIGCEVTIFAAVTTFAVLAAMGASPDLIVPLTTAGAGSILAAAATTVVTSAGRLALWASRLPVPPLQGPSGPECSDDDALRAHAVATGLICGSSAAAALGATLASVDATPVGAVFATVVGLVMVLRAGTHVDLIQSVALILCGTTSIVAAFVWSVNAHPHYAHWIALVAATLGAALTRLSATGAPAHLSPLVRRCGELIEYAALATVIPLTCLLSGVFGAVRDLA